MPHIMCLRVYDNISQPHSHTRSNREFLRQTLSKQSLATLMTFFTSKKIPNKTQRNEMKKFLSLFFFSLLLFLSLSYFACAYIIHFIFAPIIISSSPSLRVPFSVAHLSTLLGRRRLLYRSEKKRTTFHCVDVASLS